MAMRVDFHILKRLEKRAEQYLKQHPGMTFSSLIQEAIELKLRLRPNRILELAGFASLARVKQRKLREIQQDQLERPEDEVTRRGLDRA
jgi:hypothetical protein